MPPAAHSTDVLEPRAGVALAADAASSQGGDPSVVLGRAYAACEAIVRSRARNFYFGLRLTPRPQRDRIYAAYAWMRLADDLADDSPTPEQALRALRHLREATIQGLRADPHTPAAPPPIPEAAAFWPAFLDTARHARLELPWLLDMLDGLEQDVHHPGFETQDQLWRYCEQVGSVPGMVSVAVWGLRPGVDRAHALALAKRRGRAFQLTNILRDVACDQRLGRVYLPGHALREAGVMPSQLGPSQLGPTQLGPNHLRSDLPGPPAGLLKVIREQARLAEAEYDASRGLEHLITEGAAPVLWTMTAIYHRLLRRIRAHPEVALGPAPARLRSYHKAVLALRGIALGRLGAFAGASRARDGARNGAEA